MRSVFFKKLKRMPWATKILVAEISLRLALNRGIILLIPFKKIASNLGVFMKESTYSNSEEYEEVAKIRTLILKVGHRIPWVSNCYSQALCAAGMLRRRRISHTLYFGLHKTKSSEYIAHCWLRSGDLLVTGEMEHDRYTTAGSFMWTSNS